MQDWPVAPGLGSATMIETRVGFRPISPDGKPQLGSVRGWDGLLIGNGMGPSGLTIGPYAGKLLAQLAFRASQRVDLSAYRARHADKSRVTALSRRHVFARFMFWRSLPAGQCRRFCAPDDLGEFAWPCSLLAI